MLNVDRGSHGDLVALAIRLHRMECRGLHQANHVRGGVDRWQSWMMSRQGVFELNGLFRLAAHAQRDVLQRNFSLEKKRANEDHWLKNRSAQSYLRGRSRPARLNPIQRLPQLKRRILRRIERGLRPFRMRVDPLT